MEFVPEKGTSFHDAVRECKKEIVRTGRLYMMMTFNEINVTISIDSNPDDIATIYDLKHELRRLKK